MTKKLITFGSTARKSVQTGVNTVLQAVQSSYGPLGKTAVIGQSYGAPIITNDGVTIAKSIELEGFEQLGVSLIQQAANKTNDIAGDGTTLTTVLAGNLINEGIRVVEAGSDAVHVKQGIQKAVTFILEKLNNTAKAVTDNEMADVATISSRDRNIGEMIARMLIKVGKDGVVTVQNGESNVIEEELTEGMQFDKGFKSPYFVTDTTRMEAVLEKPAILVTDKKISSIQDVLPVIEQLAQQGKKELVIIAEDIEGEALATFVLNKIRGVFNILAVQAPAFGDRRKSMLEDIAVLTGATFISSDLGMTVKSATIDDLGYVDRIVSTKDTTTLIGGKGDKDSLNSRINSIKLAIEEAKSDYDREKLQERLAKLAGGVGVIKVGAATEVELKELKYLVEDALNATKAAVAEGVVPGGASTWVRIAKQLDELTSENESEQVGISLVKKVLLAPFRAIAKNSAIYDISILVEQIEKSKSGGYDFKSMKMVDDMIKAGIMDPVLVLKQAISNASSIATSVITMEVIVTDEPKKDESAGEGGMPGMGMGGY